MNHRLEVPFGSPGIVTLLEWTMMPDGDSSKYVWAPQWKILTDKQMPVEGFRSSEKWTLLALDEAGQIVGVFPGCQVKGWVYAKRVMTRGVYALGCMLEQQTVEVAVPHLGTIDIDKVHQLVAKRSRKRKRT